MNLALPQHVIAKLERRWAGRLQRDVRAWTGERRARQFEDRAVVGDGGPPIPVTLKRSRRPAPAASD
jgi:hypothetical protein